VQASMQGRLGWVIFTVLLIALFVAVWVATPVLELFSKNPPVTGAQLGWLAGIVLVCAGILVAGKAINGRWSGVLIDSRNRYSLSQVQAVLWLVLVSSGIVAIAVSNVRNGQPAPLDLSIPPELLAAIGLSITTFVGTPLIRATKQDKVPEPTQAARTLGNLGLGSTQVSGAQVFAFSGPAPADGTAPVSYAATTEGTVVTYSTPQATSWADLLRGEETGNADKVDLGKLQLMYVTAAAVVVYGIALFAALGLEHTNGSLAHLAFPALDASFVGILALSTGGALASQAAPHAKTV
jgi:hypothetical protein